NSSRSGPAFSRPTAAIVIRTDRPSAGRSDGYRRRRMIGPPHLLEVVEGADFRSEEMDDHVAGVDQDPVGGFQALDPDVADALVLQVLKQPVGHGADMTIRAPGGSDHVVAERRL